MKALHCGALLSWVVLCACSPPEHCEPMLNTAPISFDVPVHRWVSEPDVHRAIDVAFVAEGFTVNEFADFADRVEAMIAKLRTNTLGIVGRRPDLFNFYRLDTFSDTNRTTNAARTDTYFGTCLDEDSPSSGLVLTGNIPRAQQLTASWVPNAEVVVMLVNNTNPRARPGTWQGSWYAFDSPQNDTLTVVPAVVVMSANDSEAVLTHELGHALVNLGDEYSEGDQVFAPNPDFAWVGDVELDVANLTTDATGAKWSTLVAGTIPGGGRTRTGLFHPTTRCRMNDAETLEFCPVCTDAIEQTLAARRDVNDGPPRILLGIANDGSTLQGSAFDRNGIAQIRARIDGTIVNDAVHTGVSATFAVNVYAPPASATPKTHTFQIETVDRFNAMSSAETTFTK